MEEDAHDRLCRILEEEVSEKEEEKIKNGCKKDDANCFDKKINEENYKNLSDETVAVLKRVSQRDLLKIFDNLIGGKKLENALNDVAGDVYEQIKKAGEDQYKTIKNEENIEKNNKKNLCMISTNEIFSSLNLNDSDYFIYAAKFIPLRLTYEERRFLRLLESALEVSEYVDKIDILHTGNKARRIAMELRQICAILSGLVIAHNYEDGQRLVRDREYRDNADFFRSIFEIGRRYKILNPERMRNSYGKLIYLLMDSRKYEIAELLQIDFVSSVNTVYKLLENRKNGLELLRDPLVAVATMEIRSEGKTRNQTQKEIQTKEEAIKILSKKYATKKSQKKQHGLFGFKFSFFSSPGNYNNNNSCSEEEENEEENEGLTTEDIQQVLYSIGDHNTYLRFNRDPCEQMILYLRRYFHPYEYEENYNLAITSGRGGSRLNHDHMRQFMYVLQSLTFWREIAHEMFNLWHLAETDLLESKNVYRLRDTGQGLNRVQDAPRVCNAMQQILHRVQQEVGGWIGSSVIHLGDHNVPNALIFIDKYTQVPRILSPIVLCLKKINEICESKASLREYVNKQFGGPEEAIKKILCDFFRHGFDGSGADNFYDAGSCIDGRLTSAWNWCSKIESKNYFPLFLLTGFTGFDGRF